MTSHHSHSSPSPNIRKEDDSFYYDEVLLEDDVSDDDDYSEHTMYDEYELETSFLDHVNDEPILEDTITDDGALNEDDNYEDLSSDDSDEYMSCDDEYMDDADDDYIDDSDEEMIEYISHNDKAFSTPHSIATVATRNSARRSYLTTKTTPPCTIPCTFEYDMHTTVQKASTDTLTLIGILNDKQSVHRSCFLGFYCGDGFNCKERQPGFQLRSTDFAWLNDFIKAFKCTNVNFNFRRTSPKVNAIERYAAGNYGAVIAKFYSHELRELLDSPVYPSSKVTFPDDLPNRDIHILLFILWYYAADGCLLWRPELDVENPGLLLAGVNLAARDKTMLVWMQTELAKLGIQSNIVGQESDTAYNLNIGKREMVRHKDLFLSAIDLVRVVQIPLQHKLIDLETMLKTGMIPYSNTAAATDVSFYDYLGVDGLPDPFTRVIAQDTCVLRLTALNQFLQGLGMEPVRDTRDCHPADISTHLRSIDARSNILAKKYYDMCVTRVRKDMMPNNVVNERGRLHRCDKCAKTYHTKDMLTSHKVREHAVKGEEWQCDECDLVLSTKTTLRLHKFNIHSGELTCDSCNETFENYRTYYDHKVIMHQCEEIQCPWEGCDATFNRKKSFYHHVYNHNCSENKLACPFEGCDRLFLRHDHLRDHVDSIHKKEPIACRVDGCDSTFYSQVQEYTHYQRMHVKRHHCNHPSCDKSFGKPSDLQRHVMLNHENPDLSDILIEEETPSNDLQELVDQLATSDPESRKRKATAAGLTPPTNVTKQKVGYMGRFQTQSRASADDIPKIVFSKVPMHDQLGIVKMIKASPLNATIILDKSNIEEATHVVTYAEDPSTIHSPSYLYAINDSDKHIISTTWIADSVANGNWLDEELYTTAIPRKDVLRDIQLTFIGNAYPLRQAIERISKVSGAQIWGKRPAWQSKRDTSKIVQNLTNDNIDPNITICIVTDEKTFVHKKSKLKNAQVRTIRWLVELLAHQRKINRI
ncbi:hypothetical protein K492DRAFT_206926 [Lichtheimia hyalospora FSU 10163]|nr:hypothetical protein K492DRAFT_206926 [Lichtheimia hyalospora FSU 10163]